MGTGVFLMILGAILAFAVRDQPGWLDLHVVGVILMAAGAAIIHVVRRGWTRTREVTDVEDRSDPTAPTHIKRETVIESHPRS